MPDTHVIDRLTVLIDSLSLPEGYSESPLDGLGFVNQSAPSALTCTVYEPVVCLILRGRKRTSTGSTSVDFGPRQSLIVSHDVPVLSEITEAPYLALILRLDMNVLHSLVDQIEHLPAHDHEPATLDVHETDDELLDALFRYVALSTQPTQAVVLGPLVLREIHFRLATAPHGAMLRRLLQAESAESTINKAIDAIRNNYRSSLSVPDLAGMIGMSESTFHRHFKTITGTTPLQYQKSLRLLEARRLISVGGLQVSSAAYEVGYVSPTQFSREYAREFGVSPRQHSRLA